MKIGYILLAHKDPEQIARLISRLDSPDSYFSLHLDRKMKRADVLRFYAMCADKRNIFFVERSVRIYWGSITIVNATLAAIDCLRRKGVEPDFVVLLSGEHYPLKSPREIADFLDKNKNKLFMDYNRLPDMKNWPQTRGGLTRLKPRYFFIGGYPFDFGHVKWLCAKTLRRLGLIKPRSPKPDSFYLRGFPAGYVPYGGSQWWSLPISAVDHIQNEIRRLPEIMRFFSKTYIPSESFFHTIILNSPFKDSVVNDNLTFIKWGKSGDSHPNYLTMSDFDRLISSGNFFSRKFSRSASADLQDAIDKIIT